MRRHTVLAEVVVPEQETCPTMQQFIERMATKHQVDLSVAGVRLWLALRGTKQRLLSAGLSGHRIGVTHCIADAEEYLSCDTDMVFLIVEDDLLPVELLHTDAVGVAYAQVMAATGAAQVQDGEGNFNLACFAEFWAEQLTQQRWLEAGQRLYV